MKALLFAAPIVLIFALATMANEPTAAAPQTACASGSCASGACAGFAVRPLFARPLFPRIVIFENASKAQAAPQYIGQRIPLLRRAPIRRAFRQRLGCG